MSGGHIPTLVLVLVLVFPGALVAADPADSSSHPASASQAATDDAVRQATLDALHNGRFDAAEQMMAPLAGAPDVDARDALLWAFVTYWRTLYDPDDRELQDELEVRLKRTIQLANVELKGNRRGDATLWKGSAHMLRAQLRATQKKIFGAAFEAKRAKKMLEMSVKHGSAPAESDFGLGTYQYYADMLPAVVKGLRAILFIPGGNREEGLERLERASRESRYFALESRIILANIYADDKERMYDAAESVVAAALDRYPDTLAALHGAARLDLALNRPAAALDDLDHALAVSAAHGDTAESVVLTLRYYSGAAEYLRFRPDRALELLQPILTAPESAPEPIVRRVRRMAAIVALVPDRAAWTETVTIDSVREPSDDPAELRRIRAAGDALLRARPALERERMGDEAGAGSALETLLAERPDDAMTLLLCGRARLRNGRGADALPLLERAIASKGVPATYGGIARLLAGMAADAFGTREAALDWYHEAEDKHRFLGRDAARMYQERPYVESVGSAARGDSSN